MRGQLRSDAANLTVHNALTSTYIPHEVRYSNVCAVRDEEAAGSNPATPTQVTGPFPVPRAGRFRPCVTGASSRRAHDCLDLAVRIHPVEVLAPLDRDLPARLHISLGRLVGLAAPPPAPRPRSSQTLERLCRDEPDHGSRTRFLATAGASGKFSGRPLPMLLIGGRPEMGSCCRRRSDGLPS